MKIKKFNENKNNNAEYFLAGDIKEFIRELNDEFPDLKLVSFEIPLSHKFSYGINLADDDRVYSGKLIRCLYDLFDDTKILEICMSMSTKSKKLDSINNILKRINNHIKHMGIGIWILNYKQSSTFYIVFGNINWLLNNNFLWDEYVRIE